MCVGQQLSNMCGSRGRDCRGGRRGLTPLLIRAGEDGLPLDVTVRAGEVVVVCEKRDEVGG